MGRPSFASVERNYSISINGPYANTCAVRMSMALSKADVMLKQAFKTSIVNKTAKGYIRGAQDLAAILRKVWGVPDQSWAGLTGKPIGNGVICYMNIQTYSGQGHIGLWKNGAPYDNDAYWSASPVWFWRLK